jgi:uncharacterized protein (TIGR02145 family)
MKETGTVHWLSPNTGATNSSGFTALPGGSSYAGSFFSLGENGDWWSSYRLDAYCFFMSLHYNDEKVYIGPAPNGSQGFSVRCLKD